MASASIGIQRIEALHYYVHDLDRTRRFFVDKLDFVEIGTSGPQLEQEGRQRSAAFRAGGALFVIHQPVGEGGRAWRYLRKHPEGVGTVVFDVDDVDRAFALLDERGGTFITDVQRFQDDAGTLAMFSITTPFGDTTFRFIERRGYQGLFPGFVPAPAAGAARKRVRLRADRSPDVELPDDEAGPALDAARARLRAVLGDRVPHQRRRGGTARGREHGSGLKSVVMWDPDSGVKFANNEPFRPFFKESQINLFAEDNRGDGVQHSALAVTDIVTAVRGLRERGVEFMPTPGSYFDVLPARLERIGVGQIEERHRRAARARASWSTAARAANTCCRSSSRKRPACTTIARRGRSSSRSSSARAIRASARGTSARCSRRSNGTAAGPQDAR